MAGAPWTAATPRKAREMKVLRQSIVKEGISTWGFYRLALHAVHVPGGRAGIKYSSMDRLSV
jgi:hypothetical protein